MMKKIIGFTLAVSMLLFCVSCGKLEQNEETNNDAELLSEKMTDICELAVMECRYHNVARYNEVDAEKFFGMQKGRKFWMEYSGVVTVGIDASHVEIIKVEGDDVYIALPPTKVFENSCRVDENSLANEEAFVIEKNFGSAKVKAEHQTKAMQEAQRKMLDEASNDTLLLENARQRAESLIRQYVEKTGKSMGKDYQVHFLDIDEADESQITSETTEPDGNP